MSNVRNVFVMLLSLDIASENCRMIMHNLIFLNNALLYIENRIEERKRCRIM